MPAPLALNMNFTAPVKAASPQPAASSPAASKPQTTAPDTPETPKSPAGKSPAANDSNKVAEAPADGSETGNTQETGKSNSFADLLKQLGLNKEESDSKLPVAKEETVTTDDTTAPVDLAQLLAALPPPAPPTAPTEAKPAIADGTTDALQGVAGKGGNEAELMDPGVGKTAKTAGNFEELLAQKETTLETTGLKTGQADNAAAVQAHSQSQPVHRTETPTSSHIATPVRHPDWSNDFSQKVVWLANSDKQTAQLTLNPPQLGPIEITLDISNDKTNALFAVANPETRQAIESALPQLREAFASAGLELGQANVSADNPRQQQEARPEGGSQRLAGDGILPGESVSGSQATATPIRRGLGMVDTFA